MCNCDAQVQPGNYLNQVTIDIPAEVDGMRKLRVSQGLSPSLSIDKCIVGELQSLWSLGIETTGCCCGHNAFNPFIGVTDQFIPRMKELGYMVQRNPMRPDAEDSFWPKTIAPLTKEQVG